MGSGILQPLWTSAHQGSLASDLGVAHHFYCLLVSMHGIWNPSCTLDFSSPRILASDLGVAHHFCLLISVHGIWNPSCTLDFSSPRIFSKRPWRRSPLLLSFDLRAMESGILQALWTSAHQGSLASDLGVAHHFHCLLVSVQWDLESFRHVRLKFPKNLNHSLGT